MELKKNPKANLEKYRLALVFLGLTFAGSLSVTALELVSLEKDPVELAGSGSDKDRDFENPYVPEEPPPPPPDEPPPPEEPPAPLDPPPADTEEADDDDEVENTPPAPPDAPPPPPPPPPPKPKAKVYDFPQQEASYPGGMEAMYKFLYSKISYPKMAKAAGIQGKVFVEFVVDESGNVKNVKLLKGIGGGCDEQALDAIRALPKWAPAEQAGTKVQQRFKLPVKFELE